MGERGEVSEIEVFEKLSKIPQKKFWYVDLGKLVKKNVNVANQDEEKFEWKMSIPLNMSKPCKTVKKFKRGGIDRYR